jgi:nicotinamidase-related amidase
MERVWEKFLTERDKQHLTQVGWVDRAPYGFGRRPAVIVVDDYYASVGLERQPLLEAITTWPGSCGIEGWDAIDRTVELLEVARANDVPIIYFHDLEDFPSAWGGRPRGPAPWGHLPAEIAAKANQIIEEVAPHPGDLVLKKEGPSGFHRTPLQDHLTYLGIDTLIVVGESTSGCVRSTVVDGAANRYRMGVVEECVFDRTEAAHAINLFDMDLKYADVISLSEAQRYLATGSTAPPDALESTSNAH